MTRRIQMAVVWADIALGTGAKLISAAGLIALACVLAVAARRAMKGGRTSANEGLKGSVTNAGGRRISAAEARRALRQWNTNGNGRTEVSDYDVH